MKHLRQWLRNLRQPKPPVIMTECGPVTEWARHQAAINMKLKPEVKERVILDIMSRKQVARERAEEIARTNYPEAYE